MEPTTIILGLGNPGPSYEYTRHNAGFLAVDHLATSWNWYEDTRSNALCAPGRIGAVAVLAAKPTTYMNRSGTAARALLKKYQLSPEHLIVIHDDLDLPLGALRTSFDSGSGGHNGIHSILTTLGTKRFIRLRLGIAPISQDGRVQKPHGTLFTSKKRAVEKYVLGPFSSSEQETFSSVLSTVDEVITTIITDGVQQAMNQYNKTAA